MKAGRYIDGGAKGAHKHRLVEWIGVSQQYSISLCMRRGICLLVGMYLYIQYIYTCI